MSRPAVVPDHLRHAPFRGSTVVAEGLLTRGQLAGASWRRLLPDVYAHRDATVDHHAWCRAALLGLPPGSVVSHGSAVAGYVPESRLGPPAAVGVTVPTATRLRSHPRLEVHRDRLPPEDVMRRCGLLVTTPRRTAFDVGRDPDRHRAVIALDALLYQRAVRPGDLHALCADRLGWPGATRFRHAAALARCHVESPMESLLRLTVVDAGLPEPAVQHEIRTPRGALVARVDLAYEEARVALEYDGDHHRERTVFRRDADRVNRIHLAGWTVLRFTADDLLRNPSRMLRVIARALRDH